MGEIREAVRLYYRGELPQAEIILKRFLREEPTNISALVRMADIQKDLGKMEKAGETYLKVAGIYEKEGNYEDSLEYLEKASPYFPQAKTAPQIGRLLFQLGRYDEALSYLIVSPPESEILFFTAKSYFFLNQYNNALRVFREILEGEPAPGEMIRACYWAAKSLYALGELEEAIACYKSYIYACPREKQAHFDLALCYLNSGRFDMAESSFLQFKKLGGSEELLCLYLGIVYYHQGNYKEVIKLLDQIPICVQALHWKGLALYELSRYEEALECFTTAAKQEARPLYYKMMGNASLRLQYYFEAKICYEKALDLDPTDHDLEKLIAIAGNCLK